MPFVKVNILKGKTKEYKTRLFKIIQDSLVKSIKIPNTDINQRIIEFKKEDFQISPNKTENMTIIEIIMFPGRTNEAKKNLFKTISEALNKELKIDPNDIITVLLDPSLENWGLNGKSGNKTDIGLNLKK